MSAIERGNIVSKLKLQALAQAQENSAAISSAIAAYYPGIERQQRRAEVSPRDALKT